MCTLQTSDIQGFLVELVHASETHFTLWGTETDSHGRGDFLGNISSSSSSSLCSYCLNVDDCINVNCDSHLLSVCYNMQLQPDSPSNHCVFIVTWVPSKYLKCGITPPKSKVNLYSALTADASGRLGRGKGLSSKHYARANESARKMTSWNPNSCFFYPVSASLTLLSFFCSSSMSAVTLLTSPSTLTCSSTFVLCLL